MSLLPKPPKSVLLVPTKHVFEANTEVPCNPECTFERRRITALLYGDDRLTSNANSIAELRLSHGTMLIPKLTYAVGDWRSFSHRLNGVAVKENPDTVFRQLADNQACENAVEKNGAAISKQINTER